MKPKDRFNELQIHYAKYAGIAEVLEELKQLKNFDDLKEYIKKKHDQFWEESTPIAVDLCKTLVEMGKELSKEEKDKDD